MILNAGEIGKMEINLFLSRFSTDEVFRDKGFFGVCIFKGLQYQLH